jgi:hypothetical protein
MRVDSTVEADFFGWILECGRSVTGNGQEMSGRPYFMVSSELLLSASRDSRTEVLRMSTKLAIKKPKIPPSTAEERPPRSAPAKDDDASNIKAVAPEMPPMNPPIPTDIGNSQPVFERLSR